jgi:hypothetical protein
MPSLEVVAIEILMNLQKSASGPNSWGANLRILDDSSLASGTPPHFGKNPSTSPRRELRPLLQNLGSAFSRRHISPASDELTKDFQDTGFGRRRRGHPLEDKRQLVTAIFSSKSEIDKTTLTVRHQGGSNFNGGDPALIRGVRPLALSRRTFCSLPRHRIRESAGVQISKGGCDGRAKTQT